LADKLKRTRPHVTPLRGAHQLHQHIHMVIELFFNKKREKIFPKEKEREKEK
jgi:hypothetical protein